MRLSGLRGERRFEIPHACSYVGGQVSVEGPLPGQDTHEKRLKGNSQDNNQSLQVTVLQQSFGVQPREVEQYRSEQDTSLQFFPFQCWTQSVHRSASGRP